MFQVWEWCATTCFFFFPNDVIFYVIFLYILEPFLRNHQNLLTNSLPRFSISILLNIHLFILHRFPADSWKIPYIGCSLAISPKKYMIVPHRDHIDIAQRCTEIHCWNQQAQQSNTPWHDEALRPLWNHSLYSLLWSVVWDKRVTSSSSTPELWSLGRDWPTDHGSWYEEQGDPEVGERGLSYEILRVDMLYPITSLNIS